MSHDDHMDRAIEQANVQRCADFAVVRAWVFDHIEHDPARLAHDLACMLAGAPGPYSADYDYRVADANAVDALRARMADAIAEQPATAELADDLREDAEEEAREEAAEAADDAAYARACERAIPNIPAW